MQKILLADRQDITRAGMQFVCLGMNDVDTKYVEDKAELILSLKESPDSVVVLDYTLFDFNDADELLIFNLRFPNVRWVLFSEDLTQDFVKQIVASSNQFSVVLKESPMNEIREALRYAMSGQRYICQRTAELLLSPQVSLYDDIKLTKTETEILKDIALGMTTKEIADKRISSFHTVNTHRKNIFRKLGVNNVHEATKYALRAGLVDSAEYYI